MSVAITGGIGAGKSEALKAFARHGAATISSDEIVHRLLREDEDVKRAIVERLGRVVLRQGQIDRSRVAKIVFRDRDKLTWLEELLHPLVSAAYLRWREQQTAPVTATEVPLLFEAGSARNFDAVVVITAPAEARRQRSALATDDRESRLIPDEEKVARADYAYVNDGTLEQLDAFVAGVVEDLAKRAA
ncbi:MAG TPA: dephospho-CoA kinase [Gaiellaceae bacterium]|nr:dephospho-CoA kinase [Gaiellaceae bacterium]